MTTVPIQAPGWRKSSHSDGQDTCVELAGTLNAMRDSKNPRGPVLSADAAALVAAVKDDRISQ